MMDFGAEQAKRLLADAWWKMAQRGDVCVGRFPDSDRAILLRYALGAALSKGECRLHIDCNDGHADVWELVRMIGVADSTVTAFVTGRAVSAGLWLCVAADGRVAVDGATFGFHGDVARFHHGHSDSCRAQYMAERTDADYDFWHKKATQQPLYEFGVGEAKELGVIHEIAPWKFGETDLPR